MDIRKDTKVFPEVKDRLQDLKRFLDLKNESQVISYLLAVYDAKYPQITHLEHLRYKEAAERRGRS